VLAPLEIALNHALNQDSFTRQTLAASAGKVLAIQLRDTGLVCFLTVRPDGLLRLSMSHAEPPQARIDARPFSLLRLLSQTTMNLAGQTEVRLEGDIGFAQSLATALKGLRFDWEENLAKLFGDLPAHWLGRSLRAGWAWGRDNWASAPQALAEYTQEELRLLPAHAEVQAFLDEVDELRATTERLTQRIQRLESKP